MKIKIMGLQACLSAGKAQERLKVQGSRFTQGSRYRVQESFKAQSVGIGLKVQVGIGAIEAFTFGR
jgi:hypothetical protein